MAHNDAKVPLLPGSNDPSMIGREDGALTRRRYQRFGRALSKRTDPQGHKIVESLRPPEFDWISKPSLLRVFLVLALYLSAGTICFYLVWNQLEGKKTNGIVDAIYFCIVTMTTVGYGDLVPGSTLAKLLACLFVFSGMAIVGMLLSKAADYLVEKQEILIAKATHLHDKVAPSEILEEVESHKTKYKFMISLSILITLIIAGTFTLIVVEKMRIIDAFYCVCATITTLGYGDESFSTEGGRIFAVFWILSSTICLAQFYFYLAELYTESRQKSLVKWVLGRKLTYADFEAADLDNDRVVSAAEFILYKLKEMEKISEEDISVVMQCFRNLDMDHSGTLIEADISSA
ncbi:hypothetical protein Ancab_004766 [Ancistrocladus abbreviatus]